MSVHTTSTHARARPQRPDHRGSTRTTRRLKLLRGAFTVLFVVLGIRLFALQVVDHNHFAKLSVEQVRQDLTTTALRGGIYDRYGQILAVSRPTSLVLADDYQIKQPLSEAQAMSAIVKVPVKKLDSLLSENNGYVILTNHLDITSGHQLSAMALPGIVVQDSSLRSYPNGPIATSLLGGTNAAGRGSAGIEYEYQKMLAGQSGITRAFVSAGGVNLPSSYSTVIRKAVPGVGLELTIDTSLQFVTERALAHEISTSGALSGIAVVMDVKTGEILANASLVNTKTTAGILGPIPAWGQSMGVGGVQQTINDLAFTQAYEPGSVFKVVPFTAALEGGLITPSTVFTVPNSITVGGRRFHDAENHAFEHLSATQILAQSSNIGTYKVASRVGEAGLLAQVERLGFGQTTAVNFPGETPGLLVNAMNWYASDAVALPIGQVDAVPPIQVLDAYNTVANGGVYVAQNTYGGTSRAVGRCTRRRRVQRGSCCRPVWTPR